MPDCSGADVWFSEIDLAEHSVLILRWLERGREDGNLYVMRDGLVLVDGRVEKETTLEQVWWSRLGPFKGLSAEKARQLLEAVALMERVYRPLVIASDVQAIIARCPAAKDVLVREPPGFAAHQGAFHLRIWSEVVVPSHPLWPEQGHNLERIEYSLDGKGEIAVRSYGDVYPGPDQRSLSPPCGIPF